MISMIRDKAKKMTLMISIPYYMDILDSALRK